MRLEVQLFASLRERAGTERLELTDLPDELTVGELKRLVAERHPELGDLGSVAGVVDARYVPDSTLVGADADVALLPPVSGGSGESAVDAALRRGVFELSAESLDPGALLARVAHPSCGGSVVFTGTTRGTNRQRDVVRLDYEAFEAMAGPEMGRIFDDCRRELDVHLDARAHDPEALLRMLCVHRTGTVGVGEVSVVVAVASPHRDLAFRAARLLIDRLKERLPVWKKEVYTDGQHWIGDRS